MHVCCSCEPLDCTIPFVADCLNEILETHDPLTVKEALEGLQKMANVLKDSGWQGHCALHDILCLKAETNLFFTVNKYRSISSSPVKLSDQDVPTCSAPVTVQPSAPQSEEPVVWTQCAFDIL